MVDIAQKKQKNLNAFKKRLKMKRFFVIALIACGITQEMCGMQKIESAAKVIKKVDSPKLDTPALIILGGAALTTVGVAIAILYKDYKNNNN